jgi:hypothetical protein
MSDRFDFEQQIQKCWMVTDDIKEVSEYFLEYHPSNLTQDRVANILIGLAELYEIKFNKLWDLFEDVHMNLVRENKMLNEECVALRQQLIDAENAKYGAGKGVPSGAGADGFGIAAIKPKKKDKK